MSVSRIETWWDSFPRCSYVPLSHFLKDIGDSHLFPSLSYSYSFFLTCVLVFFWMVEDKIIPEISAWKIAWTGGQDIPLLGFQTWGSLHG